jgi:hypothetical protein
VSLRATAQEFLLGELAIRKLDSNAKFLPAQGL